MVVGTRRHRARSRDAAVRRDALEDLPQAQRLVVALRDVHGWQPPEVCAALNVSEANQRVLPHRGRSRLRAVLERYLGDADALRCNAWSIRETKQRDA